MEQRPRLENQSLSGFVLNLLQQSSFRALSKQTTIPLGTLHAIAHGTIVIPEWLTKVADAFGCEWVLQKKGRTR